MNQNIKTHCPSCDKPLTPGEMIDMWCETCERAADKPAEQTKARAAA